MNDKTPSPGKFSINYGLYLGILLVLVSLTYYLTGNEFANTAQWISYAVMITGIVLAQLNFRKNLGGYMSYGQALAVGVITMFFASILTSLYTCILYQVIDPALKEQIRLMLEEQLVTQNMPEAQINIAMKIITIIQKPSVMAILEIFSGTFTGLIISFITSIFTQKKADEIM